MSPATAYRILLPLLAGILLLPFPLLGDLHIESAMLAAVIGAFAGGWIGSSPSEHPDARRLVRLFGAVALAGLPLLTWSLFTGCFSIDGLSFWLLYPFPSVGFGFAAGRLIRHFPVSRPRLLCILFLTLLALGTFLTEFFTLPQIYFFNHVWGGWPGPLYDEVVEAGRGLLWYRGLTVAWSLLFWFLPSAERAASARWIVAVAGILLAVGYTQLTEMRIITPESHIRSELGGRHATEHFTLWYDRDRYSDFEVERTGAELEFYLQNMSRILELETPDETVHTYLYAHPWQKKRLTGAKFTSYVPVWLERDQLHVARGQIEQSLRHELVHVLAKAFGNRLINASWSIGLVEGLAVALAPDRNSRSTVDQLVASQKPWPDAEEIRRVFSFTGFYGGRSAVNYHVSGSFVGFLLQRHPVSRFKEAYRTGDLDGPWPVPLDSLVAQWHRHLETVPVDEVAAARAEQVFGIPSLLETDCPHYQSPLSEALDRYAFRSAAQDTAAALIELDRALELSGNALTLKAEWAFRYLQADSVDRVIRRINSADRTVDLQLLYSDALLLAGRPDRAESHVELARQYRDTLTTPSALRAFAVRSDKWQWERYVDLTYRGIYPPAATLDSLLPRTLVRAMEHALERERWGAFREYSDALYRREAEREFIEEYIRMIHNLAYTGSGERALEWIEKLEALPGLRIRIGERLERERQWIGFLRRTGQPGG